MRWPGSRLSELDLRVSAGDFRDSRFAVVACVSDVRRSEESGVAEPRATEVPLRREPPSFAAITEGAPEGRMRSKQANVNESIIDCTFPMETSSGEK